ncbi:hypothetical protein EGW08_018914 [Elysia chlorotica]|uniref:Uncharacterized protein n=1 Tax=Elysia chlorotica TaxID=188477 RepID=A0A3S1B0Q4_ELYCH|nr:hypothetical protein EGW08_018914 [Elysia chlorotica]
MAQPDTETDSEISALAASATEDSADIQLGGDEAGGETSTEASGPTVPGEIAPPPEESALDTPSVPAEIAPPPEESAQDTPMETSPESSPFANTPFPGDPPLSGTTPFPGAMRLSEDALNYSDKPLSRGMSELATHGEEKLRQSQMTSKTGTGSTGSKSGRGARRTLNDREWELRQLSTLEVVQAAEIMYYKRASVIQNPLLPPRPCRAYPKGTRPPAGSCLSIRSGPDKNRIPEEKEHYLNYRTDRSEPDMFNPNSAAATPLTARRKRRAPPKSIFLKRELGWREKEERLKNFRDHKLAEEIGYETLVGNLLYIDIPKGKDINRSWQNFLSYDVMEWGFPYYKGSKERPRIKQREPYLAHQLKEKLWRYPKTRIYHSLAED